MMFSQKNKSESSKMTSGTGTTIIGAGTHLQGDLYCQNDLRIDGKLTGNIYCDAKVVIGADGVVEGNVQGQNADVLGQISGNIQIADLLNLRGKAVIKGEVHTSSLQVEPQVTFNGTCQMGAAVVGISDKKIHEQMALAK